MKRYHSAAFPAAAKVRRGFTLIELLTVIAVIGILAMILIPVASRVRESAHGTRNASNHRAIIVALLAYTLENNDTLPYADDDRNLPGQPDTRRSTYTRLLVTGGYIGDPSVFFAPKAGDWYRHEGALDSPSIQSWVPWYYTNYGANRYGAMPRAPQDGNRRPVNLNQIPDPSQLMVLRDVWRSGRDERGGGEAIFSTTTYFPPLDKRYNGRVYASFLDGRVEAFDGDELLNILGNNPRTGPPLFENVFTQ